jgi:hypothetical protein
MKPVILDLGTTEGSGECRGSIPERRRRRGDPELVSSRISTRDCPPWTGQGGEGAVRAIPTLDKGMTK